MVQTQRLEENLYAFFDGHVRQFLLVGPDRALLLDTGYDRSHLGEAVRAVTDKPVQVLLTHGDPDHAGGLVDFDEAWLQERDWPLFLPAACRAHRDPVRPFSCRAAFLL